MSDLNEFVTVVNRTSKDLKGTWNGRPYDIPANGERQLPKKVALAIRFQNPIMGAGSPMEDWNVKAQYLIGIRECGDDCSPVEQTSAPQRWNTDDLSGPNYQIVRPIGGSFGEIRQPRGAEGDVGFRK